MKVNAGKSKAMVLNREEGLECGVNVDGKRLEHMSEFKWVVLWINQVQIRQGVIGRWQVGGGLQVPLGP